MASGAYTHAYTHTHTHTHTLADESDYKKPGAGLRRARLVKKQKESNLKANTGLQHIVLPLNKNIGYVLTLLWPD